MARRIRDYAAEYQRRQERAREKGWRSYGEARHAKEVAKKTGRRTPDKVADLTPYQRRNRQARAEGYKSYWDKRQKTRQKTRPEDAYRHLRSIFGSRPAFNAKRTKERTEDFDEDDVSLVLAMEMDEMIQLLTSKADNAHLVYYR